MIGESNLANLLKTLQPRHIDGEYVFCQVTKGSAMATAAIASDAIVMLFKEEEATTLIVEKDWADQNELDYSFVAAWITLTVHSSLEAVGLTAAFSTALAARGISCNVVAGYYHDHIFVDVKDVEAAMEVLRGLAD